MRYSNHAKIRMRDRQITHQEVTEALADVTMEYPSRDGSTRRVKHGRTLAGRELKIVVDVADQIVVTVAPVRV